MTTQPLCESCQGISLPALVSSTGYAHAPLQPATCRLCDLLLHALEICPCDLEWEEHAGTVQRAAWTFPGPGVSLPRIGVLRKRRGLSLADRRKTFAPVEGAAAAAANRFPGPAKLCLAANGGDEPPYAIRLWARPIENAPAVLASFEEESVAESADDLEGITVCYGRQDVLEKLEQNFDLIRTAEEGRVAVAAPTPAYPARREEYVEKVLQTHKVHVCVGGLDFKPPAGKSLVSYPSNYSINVLCDFYVYRLSMY